MKQNKGPFKRKRSILKMGMIALIITCIIGATGTFAFAKEVTVKVDGTDKVVRGSIFQNVQEVLKDNGILLNDEYSVNVDSQSKLVGVRTIEVNRKASEKLVAAKKTIAYQAPVTAVVEETPVVAETPVVEETPVVAETPVVEETPVVAETPVVEETPVITETPVVEEVPVIMETAAVEETPPAPVAEATNGIPEGAVKTTLNCTAYTATGNATAVGVMPQANHTIASWKGLPFGTKVYIPALGTTFTVEDRGGAVTEGIIDIYMNTYNDCIQFGRQNLEAYIIY